MNRQTNIIVFYLIIVAKKRFFFTLEIQKFFENKVIIVKYRHQLIKGFFFLIFVFIENIYMVCSSIDKDSASQVMPTVIDC